MLKSGPRSAAFGHPGILSGKLRPGGGGRVASRNSGYVPEMWYFKRKNGLQGEVYYMPGDLMKVDYVVKQEPARQELKEINFAGRWSKELHG